MILFYKKKQHLPINKCCSKMKLIALLPIPLFFLNFQQMRAAIFMLFIQLLFIFCSIFPLNLLFLIPNIFCFLNFINDFYYILTPSFPIDNCYHLIYVSERTFSFIFFWKAPGVTCSICLKIRMK